MDEPGRPTGKISRQAHVPEPLPPHQPAIFDSDEGSLDTPGAESEYVIENLLDHGRSDDGELLFKVHWTGYPRSDATWEPVTALPRSKVTRYYRRWKLAMPPEINRAQVVYSWL